jgi:DNA-binding transcriptional regulator GbsR (MarR family)
MRISIEKLVKKLLGMNADPELKESDKAKHLKDFLNENDYITAYQKHFELTAKILELQMECVQYEKIIKTVVDYKTT